LTSIGILWNCQFAWGVGSNPTEASVGYNTIVLLVKLSRL
jgi:hypothetical protein